MVREGNSGDRGANGARPGGVEDATPARRRHQLRAPRRPWSSRNEESNAPTDRFEADHAPKPLRSEHQGRKEQKRGLTAVTKSSQNTVLSSKNVVFGNAIRNGARITRTDRRRTKKAASSTSSASSQQH